MKKKVVFADNMISLFIFIIGAAEIANLLGVFFHRTVSECTVVFGVLAVFFTLAWGALTALLQRRTLPQTGQDKEKLMTRTEKLMAVVFGLLLLSQILFILIGKNVYVQGDMTLETVNAFLQTDAVYQVDPLTGKPYEAGLPTRIEVLCLPMLYASLSRIFHVRAETLVLCAVPVIVLLFCYGAYACLAKSLFPDSREKRLIFLTSVSVLIWVGSYSYGMDGFGVLFSGWRGVTLRNTVLIPYTVALCLRKDYVRTLLCVLAETCIVWTLYGLGACVPVILGIALVQQLIRKRAWGKEAADG